MTGTARQNLLLSGRTPRRNIYRFTKCAQSSLFVGYTGKIHVRTYKWYGNGFRTDEDSRAFDTLGTDDNGYNFSWNNLDLTLGVKAVVGDFDGDGRDDIAVLRVMLQYTEQYMDDQDSYDLSFSNYVFGAFVDWYSFDNGSIKPNYHGHSNGSQPWNYGDNGNGWVGIRTTKMWAPRLDQVGISDNDDFTRKPGQVQTAVLHQAPDRRKSFALPLY